MRKAKLNLNDYRTWSTSQHDNKKLTFIPIRNGKLISFTERINKHHPITISAAKGVLNCYKVELHLNEETITYLAGSERMHGILAGWLLGLEMKVNNKPQTNEESCQHKTILDQLKTLKEWATSTWEIVRSTQAFTKY